MGARSSYRHMLLPALRVVQGVDRMVDETGVHAEVYGIGHRHPTAVPVSVRLATQLVSAGAPLTIRNLPALGTR